ncbi:putative mannan endo-1,4-beta-mannosidase 9 [Rhodamnia argentea]|uniref:mannan endo-1,4-beta-mannosidase n=1 Tax=Rhodamnia argentea TaxID=178133 RepID=A0A8B8QX85_9MYRT|nr:putative mannan endo-1,4-beta-mannosidase 9 [Rhodamnia argentea]
MRLLKFVVLALAALLLPANCEAAVDGVGGNGFARTSGTRFVADRKPLYLNGFNAYWMMYLASDNSTRDKVATAFQEATKSGMNIARTWAFSDGGGRALQTSPGVYNEDMFKGLDFVISEARKNRVYLILSLANNWKDFGGRNQYVQWARNSGQNLTNDDEFFTNSVTKAYYKNHIKAVLTRTNTITGVAYSDDPNIFAWELMNEPRCQSDPSGKSLQGWVREMAAYVKSIDSNHMLEVGLEGFYGQSVPGKQQINPGGLLAGTDFISNNQVLQVDFATIHMYPEQWMPNASEGEQAAFVDRWVQVHIQDSNTILKKPIILGEFGKSSKSPGYSLGKRDSYFGRLYDAIYTSASSGGSCAGGLFWQLFARGMDNFSDGYEVVLEQSPSTASIIAQQSRKMSSLT